MNGQTHIAIGLTVAYLAGCNTPAQYALIVVGSLLPDIDNAGSISRPLQNLLPRIIPRLGIVQTVDQATELTGKLIRKIFGHRGFTHWPVLVGAVWLITAATFPLSKFLALGWLLHIYADALTVNGAPLAAPVSLEKMRLLPKLISFKTGGLMEDLLCWCMWGYLGAMFTRYILFAIGVTL